MFCSLARRSTMCLSFIVLPNDVLNTVREFLVYVHGVIVGKARPWTFEVATDHFTILSYVVNHHNWHDWDFSTYIQIKIASLRSLGERVGRLVLASNSGHICM